MKKPKTTIAWFIFDAKGKPVLWTCSKTKFGAIDNWLGHRPESSSWKMDGDSVHEIEIPHWEKVNG